MTLNDRPGEPMDLAVLPDGRVLHTARTGDVRIHDPKTGLNTIAAKPELYQHDEEGMQSVAIDPNFDSNHWVYLYYSPPLDTPVDDPDTPDVNEGDAPVEGTAADFEPFEGYIQLSRFKLDGNQLALGTEQEILQVPVDRGICCHVGGDIDFDADGNLYLSTGDDTNPFESDGYTPIDERPSRNPAFDAQRSAANTNDLRGKLLRITVKSGGGYSIPPGNLFPAGTPQTKPEIYVMGLRNPFRFTVNRETNEVYIADYSPDSDAADPARGPAGQGKWMIVREPGNYGWPYCATAELPYVDYDFATGASGAPFDCANPVNESPHNTGLTAAAAGDPARRLLLLRRLRALPRARRGWDRSDGRTGLRLRPGARTRSASGRATTTACRCSTSGRGTTSRSSGWTAPGRVRDQRGPRLVRGRQPDGHRVRLRRRALRARVRRRLLRREPRGAARALRLRRRREPHPGARGLRRSNERSGAAADRSVLQRRQP